MTDKQKHFTVCALASFVLACWVPIYGALAGIVMGLGKEAWDAIAKRFKWLRLPPLVTGTGWDWLDLWASLQGTAFGFLVGVCCKLIYLGVVR